MKYVFKENISAKEYDNFVKNFPSTTFMQTSSWASVKTSWDSSFVGMYDDKRLVCAAMILKRKLFLNKKLFYIPRGFVIDYKDKKLLKEFVSCLKDYAKKNNGIDIKIDPFICFNEDNIQNIRKNKGIEIRKSFIKDTKKIISNLEDVGFKHGGYKREVNAYIQPRYTMVISLKDKDGNLYEKEDLRRTFPKNTRNYIGTYQEERGVEFSYSKNKEDVKYLISVLKETEKRQHISLRSESYFKRVMDSFPDNAVLFFAHVNIDKYIKFLEKDMSEHENKKEFCLNQIQEAKKIKKQYGNKPLAGATIVMMPTCESGIKTASFLYAGTNTNILPSLKITNGLMFYRLCYCLNNGCDYCDLGGVDGSLEDHLSTFKSKFNPNVLELVGEYDLVINKLWYNLFNMGLKILKFIRSKR